MDRQRVHVHGQGSLVDDDEYLNDSVAAGEQRLLLGRTNTMPLSRTSSWLLLLIGVTGTAVGLIVAAVGDPQWGGGIAGATAFLASVALGRYGASARAHEGPPAQMEDPSHPPSMPRDA